MVVDVCENPYVLNVLLFVEQIIKIAYYIIPIALILFLTIDFFKGIIRGDDKVSTEFKLSLKRLINVVGMFLVPTFIGVMMQFIYDLNIQTGDYAACLANTSNVSEYESKYEALKLQQEEELNKDNKRQLEEWEYWKKLRDERTKHVKPQVINDDGTGVFTGQTYDLTDEQVRRLTGICVGEKGQNKKAVAGEATMMANIYEDRGKKGYSLYDWAFLSPKNGGFYAEWSRSARRLDDVTDELIAVVKDVLVYGNRTLPLYVDDHDCLFCNSKRCSNGNKGDICYLDNDGEIIKDEDKLLDRFNSSIYIRGKTKVYTIYKESNSVPSEKYFVFYTFLSDNSGPVGYTEKSYHRVMG